MQIQIPSLFDVLESIFSQRAFPVLVVGDVIVDRYQYGEVERVSPEAPVPVVLVRGEEVRPGGAANVASNIVSLGGSVEMVGAIGRDESGRALRALLEERGIGSRLLELEGYCTIEKTRIIARKQQVVRVDREDVHWEDILANAGRTLLEGICKWRGVVVVSDYGKGFLGPLSLKEILSSCPQVIVDPKKRNFEYYSSPFLLTPNRKEAEELAGMEVRTQEDIVMAGKLIIERVGCKNLLLTLGPEGMVLFQGERIYHLPSCAREVFDVTGAGDTVVAVVALGLSCGLSLLEACIFANFCAGKVVAKVGTSTVTREEIEKDAHEWKGYIEVEKWG